MGSALGTGPVQYVPRTLTIPGGFFPAAWSLGWGGERGPGHFSLKHLITKGSSIKTHSPFSLLRQPAQCFWVAPRHSPMVSMVPKLAFTLATADGVGRLLITVNERRDSGGICDGVQTFPRCPDVSLWCNGKVSFLLSPSLNARRKKREIFQEIHWAYKVMCNYICWHRKMYPVYIECKEE